MSLLSQFFPSGSSNQNAATSFTSTLASTLDTFPVDILLVGGGGGGGTVPTTKNASCAGCTDPNAAFGGGGGGGRQIQYLGANIITGQAYPITIGAGGASGFNGGATCFGSSLVAGGGGAAGTPSTFGAGCYDANEASYNDGSWGGDTTYVCPSLSCIQSPNPSYPYFINKSCFLYSGGLKTPGTMNEFNETTNPILHYNYVSDRSGRQISVCNPVGPCAAYYGSPGGSACLTYEYGLLLSNYCPYYTPFASCHTLDIFKKIGSPLGYSYISAQGGKASVDVACTPLTAPATVLGRCWCINRYGCDIKSHYAQAIYNCCVPNIPVLVPSLPACPNWGSIAVNQYCTIIAGAGAGINTTLNKFMLCASYINGPLACLSCNSINSATAEGARWEFSPINDASLRTALMLSPSYRLLDNGPSFFNVPACACYSNYQSTVPLTDISYMPAYGEVGCGAGPSGGPLTCNFSPCFSAYTKITPSSFGYFPVVGTFANGVPTCSPTAVRMFNPAPYVLGYGSTNNPGFDPQIIPLLSAPKTPCLHAATWVAAENGVAGTGNGGGGGINVGGMGTFNVFTYTYCTGPLPSFQFPNVNAWDNNIWNTGGYGAPVTTPTVNYFRSIDASPPAVATGGSGGSGAVWVVYPTAYPEATVTGNTAIPSPPAYRVYYWIGNGSITFNK